MTAFRERAAVASGRELPDYHALWRWSVEQPDTFWSEFARFADVAFHEQAPYAVGEQAMPGTRWFPGATLNYAEHALRAGPGRGDDDVAVIFRREDGLRSELSYAELREQVAAARAGLVELGVDHGDRVAALVPNCPQTVVLFLATASLGAIWSSCSPDFGPHAVADRFVQIEPTVLVAVDGYSYNGKRTDIRDTVASVRAALPGLSATVLVPYLDEDAELPTEHGVVRTFAELLATHAGAPLRIDPVEFSHPLWILYSSGTTGLPKGIVHGHGGITLEHLKLLWLHSDLGTGDRFTWFTTTGWMMWNVLISGLLVGATVVLYDGSPSYPDLNGLWEMIAAEGITYFGTSAPYLHACRDAGLRPGARFDLSRLRTIGSTGAPLSPEGFAWVNAEAGSHVQIASISGGTDVCTAFLLASPDLPVWQGELSGVALGIRAVAMDEHNREVTDQVGELVITAPAPSMPVSFWNDDDGTRLHKAYFADIPGVWRHGDWVTFTSRGSAIIHGRSDSTINRGGVRMGTAEFYRVVETHPQVADSLVIDTSGTDGGRLFCFVVLTTGASLDDVEPDLRQALRSELSPRHVPDAFVAIDAVPRTLNGKKCEVPIKRILTGTDPDTAVSREALAEPAALDQIIELIPTLSR